MFLRNVLLAIGAVFVLAGVGLMIAWFSQPRAPAGVAEPRVENKQAVLVAKRAIPTGKLLREEDIAEKEIGPGEVRPGNISRESKKDFLGASSLRAFAEGEPLLASEFIKPGDRRFLAAVLKPGSRALSIFVDAAQSSSGLALPDDYVDVILTLSFEKKATRTVTTTVDGATVNETGEDFSLPLGRRTASESVLRNVRIVAVDQVLSRPANIAPVAALGAASAEPRTPRTVTLELFGRDPEILLVAEQLGKFQLAIRPLSTDGAARPEENHRTEPFELQAEALRFAQQFGKPQPSIQPIETPGAMRPPENRRTAPVWASDVSAAIRELSAMPLLPLPPSAPSPPKCDPTSSSTGSTLENSVRRPPQASCTRGPSPAKVAAPPVAAVRLPPERGAYD